MIVKRKVYRILSILWAILTRLIHKKEIIVTNHQNIAYKSYMDIQLSFLELRTKEVINVVSGKRLGHIIDIVFNAYGKISGIVLPAPRKFLWWKSCDDIIVRWCDIDKIGADVILVKPGCKEERNDHDKNKHSCNRKDEKNEDCRVKTVCKENFQNKNSEEKLTKKEWELIYSNIAEADIDFEEYNYYDVPKENSKFG